MIKSSGSPRYLFVDPRTKRKYGRLSFDVGEEDLVNFFRVIIQANPLQIRVCHVYCNPNSNFFEVSYEETYEKIEDEQKSLCALRKAGLLSD